MPEKVLPDEMSFRAFERSLLKRGFRKITRTEFASDFSRLALRAPFPREGSEAGFAFSAKGLTVVVWTTFIEAEGVAREKDLGWVLIKENDNALYYAHPMYRTKNFLYNLLERAAIALERVLSRPQCPLCDAFMNITRGRGLKSRYWSCRKVAHLEFVALPWDHGLRDEVLERVKKIRKRRGPYRKKLKTEGKKPGAAMFKRKGWTVTRPENKL